MQDGSPVVIGYYNKVLTKLQRLYCLARKELLDIFVATMHFCMDLLLRMFTFRTDHNSLDPALTSLLDETLSCGPISI